LIVDLHRKKQLSETRTAQNSKTFRGSSLQTVFFSGDKRQPEIGLRLQANNKLNPHMMPGPGIEPGTHWWEASGLTTAPSLLPIIIIYD